jgi:hypothetical protein
MSSNEVRFTGQMHLNSNTGRTLHAVAPLHRNQMRLPCAAKIEYTDRKGCRVQGLRTSEGKFER